jgi:hypothetical protein
VPYDDYHFAVVARVVGDAEFPHLQPELPDLKLEILGLLLLRRAVISFYTINLTQYISGYLLLGKMADLKLHPSDFPEHIGNSQSQNQSQNQLIACLDASGQ